MHQLDFHGGSEHRTDKLSTAHRGEPIINMADAHDVRGAFHQPRHRHHHHDSHLDLDDPFKADCTDKGQDSSAEEQLLKDLSALIERLLAALKSLAAGDGGQESAGQTSNDGNNAQGGDSSLPASGGDNTNSSASPHGPSESTKPVDSGKTSDNSSPTNDTTGATNSAPAGKDSVAAVVAQNDRANAAVYAIGDSAASNNLNASVDRNVPASAKGISGWGIVTDENGAAVDRSASVQIKDMQTYVHLKSGGWKLVENQNDKSNQSAIAGMSEYTNFTGATQISVDNANGVASIAAPGAGGKMDHFGVANATWTPGEFDAGSIDGVFVRADAKANENNSGLVAKLGGEWWNNPGQSDNTIVGIAGTNNFMRLTDQWQSMYFTSLDQATLEKDPPPGITSGDGAPSTQTGSAAGSDGTKLIIPFPTSDAQWQQIISTAPKGSIVFPIFSGDNSKPDSFDTFGGEALRKHIDAADAAGLKPIGYVGTGAGSKPLDQVEREIDAWYANANVQGIYLGGSGKPDGTGYATDPASEAYYTAIANYIHSKGGMAVINGVYSKGGMANPDLINVMDVQGLGEGDARAVLANQANFAPGDPRLTQPASKFLSFYSYVNAADLQSIESQAKANHIGYVYITDLDYGANPTYWNEEVASL